MPSSEKSKQSKKLSNRFGPHLNCPISTTSVLCPTLYVKPVADTILKPIRLLIRNYVIASKMSLNDLHTFGVEVAVRASGACADKKMRMRLAVIFSSLECVWVG
jgi:hypothetical protein